MSVSCVPVTFLYSSSVFLHSLPPLPICHSKQLPTLPASGVYQMHIRVKKKNCYLCTPNTESADLGTTISKANSRPTSTCSHSGEKGPLLESQQTLLQEPDQMTEEQRRPSWPVLPKESNRPPLAFSALTELERQKASSCIRGGVDWTLGSISLPRGWSNTGTVLLGRWSMPQACQFLRGIWTMPLITRFNFWSPLKGVHFSTKANEHWGKKNAGRCARSVTNV